MDVLLKMPLKVLDTAPALARTVIGALLNTAYQANGNFDGRILYLLDEVARLGYMRIIETARDAGRKFGITMQLLYQSTGQIEKQWGEEGKRAWFDGVSYRIYAVVQDVETATELESSFGSYGVLATSEGSNTGSAGKAWEASSRSRGTSQSYHEVARPLIRKAELMNDVRGDESLCWRGAPRRCAAAGRSISAARKWSPRLRPTASTKGPPLGGHRRGPCQKSKPIWTVLLHPTG